MTTHSNNKQIYKVVFVGNSKTGKSRVTNELLVGPRPDYIHNPTLGVEVHPFRFGDTIYNIWDTAGHGPFRGLGDGYFILADFFILFNGPGDRTNIEYIKEISRIRPDAPIYQVSNNPTVECVSKILNKYPRAPVHRRWILTH